MLMSSSALVGHDIGDLDLKIGNLELTDTTDSSLSLVVTVNLTNPTNYSAFIPYADVNLSWNRSFLGHASAKGLQVVPGRNENLTVCAIWEPEPGDGAELLSRYVSGKSVPRMFLIRLTAQVTTLALR